MLTALGLFYWKHDDFMSIASKTGSLETVEGRRCDEIRFSSGPNWLKRYLEVRFDEVGRVWSWP